MKMAYLSMDMFFGLIDNIECPETKFLVETMVEAVRGMREVAADNAADSDEHADGVDYAADILQEALENYLVDRANHQDMVDRPPSNPDRN